jgi:hypothetical protein
MVNGEVMIDSKTKYIGKLARDHARVNGEG